jgi:hypothetical protein
MVFGRPEGKANGFRAGCDRGPLRDNLEHWHQYLLRGSERVDDWEIITAADVGTESGGGSR